LSDAVGAPLLIFRGRDAEETARGFTQAHAWITEWPAGQLADPTRNTGSMVRAIIASKIDGRSIFDEMRSITLMLFTWGARHAHLADDAFHALPCRESRAPRASRRASVGHSLRDRGAAATLRHIFLRTQFAEDFVHCGVVMKKGDVICAGMPIAGLRAPLPIRWGFRARQGAARKASWVRGGAPSMHRRHLARTQLTVMLKSSPLRWDA
jgi:hypothetical protein